MKNLNNKKNGGFLTVEVIVAVSTIVVSILAAMSVTQKSISLSRQSLHVSEASFLLEEGAEVVRIVRDSSWSNIGALNSSTTYYPTFSGGSWTLSTTPSTVGFFTRTVNIASVSRSPATDDIAETGNDDVGTKLITITVSWTEGGNVINKTMSFYIMNIFS